MDSKILGNGATSTFGIHNPLKRIRYISEEFVAYVEIKLYARGVDESGVEFNYDHEDINKAIVYILRSKGELTLTTWQRTLVIDFDIVKKEGGFELSLLWAQFGDSNGYKVYKRNERITVSIPLGSSTIKNLKGEYSMFPDANDGPRIFLHIIEANIQLISSAQPKDQSLVSKFEKIFYDNKTINIEVYGIKPTD